MYDIDLENQEQPLPPIEIPKGTLSEAALEGIIENFILREGTDYGAMEIGMETKRQQIRKQIERNNIIITFDPNTDSVTLMTIAEWKKVKRTD